MTQTYDSSRALLALSGEDRVHFLQGILTQDVAKLADEKIQFAALLSPQGKILHDMFLIALGDRILIDTPAQYKDTLIKRLTLYKLRAKVTIADVSAEWHVAYDATGLPDPRHPGLPHRHYQQGGLPAMDAAAQENYHRTRLALGIPDSTRDFAPDAITALDAGYDLLHAVSFTKGCYVGQEITARMHYKNIARRGFYRLNDATGIPRLALLKFDEMEKTGSRVMVDNVAFEATLPAWLEPKLAQFRAQQNNQ